MKLVAESIDEWRDQEEVNEGLGDFFSSARKLVSKALEDSDDEDKVNNALKAAFAKQFGENEKTKEQILAWDLEKKKTLLKMAANALKDKTVGILKLRKNEEGKLVVQGFKVKGGASHSVKG